jgi:protein-L-isoaspartate(D-aspartate) O-methyltransferase
MRWKDFRIARERMVREQIYEKGVRDRNVLEAMLRIPRHVFLDKNAGSEAYSDHSFPIGYSQTMSQPYMVAFLCDALGLQGNERILEIGTGSGYQAAILAGICRDVYTVERVPELARRARECLHDLLFTNVTVLQGDGSTGWDEYAPFDRILLTAAASRLPLALLEQLADGGRLVGPVEKEDGTQEVVRLTRQGGQCHLERLGDCAFVRMIRDPADAPRTELHPEEPAPLQQSEQYGR